MLNKSLTPPARRFLL